jgi:hypothetical protein
MMLMKNIMLRVDDRLGARLEELAAAERRSLNQQAIILIEAALRRRDEVMADATEERRPVREA